MKVFFQRLKLAALILFKKSNVFACVGTKKGIHSAIVMYEGWEHTNTFAKAVGMLATRLIGEIIEEGKDEDDESLAEELNGLVVDEAKVDKLMQEPAEVYILGAVMLDSDAMNKVYPALTPQMFKNEKRKCIYDAMWHLYEENMPIDLLTVAERMRDSYGEKFNEEYGGAKYLVELTSCVLYIITDRVIS